MDCSLLCPWNSLGRSTRVGCHFLLQETFQTQEQNLYLLHCKQIPNHWATWEAPVYSSLPLIVPNTQIVSKNRWKRPIALQKKWAREMNREFIRNEIFKLRGDIISYQIRRPQSLTTHSVRWLWGISYTIHCWQKCKMVLSPQREFGQRQAKRHMPCYSATCITQHPDL